MKLLARKHVFKIHCLNTTSEEVGYCSVLSYFLIQRSCIKKTQYLLPILYLSTSILAIDIIQTGMVEH